MKKVMRLIVVPMLMILASPAWSSVVQVYSCQQDENATEEAVEAQASKWLKAAKSQKGGANLELHLHWHLAAQMDENDFMFVLSAPSAEEWGTFMDNYRGSPAAMVDAGLVDLADCPDSALFESVAIKAK